MSRFVLDTSALLAYIENEPGSNEIEGLFNRALDSEAILFVSSVSYIEVFYISWREQGEEVAIERLELLDDLPLHQEPLAESLIEIVGEIKVKGAMSFADCCIAGLAKLKQATLVHKDPEYEQIENEIIQLRLPYKSKSK